MRKVFTDEEVTQEIERLRNSPMVRLARAEERIRYENRRLFYQLRALENRGIKLAAQGITEENIRSFFLQSDEEAEA